MDLLPCLLFSEATKNVSFENRNNYLGCKDQILSFLNFEPCVLLASLLKFSLK